MRLIATQAEVSLGNAYYYFKSKEHLIQAYYGRSHTEHLDICLPSLDEKGSLEDRLRHVLYTKIQTSTPYHRFAGQLFRTAADPESPLSPFSAESLPVRREATELMSRVVGDSKIQGELEKELPNLLWLYLMGIILFWIHDSSEDTTRTYKLIDRTSSMVARLIQLAGLRPMRPIVTGVLALTSELRDLSAVPKSTSPQGDLSQTNSAPDPSSNPK